MLLVMVSHCASQGWLPGFLGHGVGGMGVVLFFTLSGFLMAYLYADLPFNRAEVTRYARHRIGRVVPLYIAIVLISFFLFRYVGSV